MPRGTAPAQRTTNAAAISALYPLPSIEQGRTRIRRTLPISFWTGFNEPNDRTSGSEGTGGYQGTGPWQEGGYAGRFIAGRGGCWHVRPRTAVNFCCTASCGSTDPNHFRNKIGAPSFWVGQGRASDSKLSEFDFTSTAVYCHACVSCYAPPCPPLWHMSIFLAKKYFFPPA